MNKKIFAIIVGIIFLIGGVLAANILNNTTDIQMPSQIIAGKEFVANFSFEYWDNLENEDESPLIIQLNLNSGNSNYPVGKGEFNISGYIEKSSLFGFWKRTVEFNCTDSAPYTIEHSIDNITVLDIPDGTFYCYNENLDLRLNERDRVYLKIISDIAIWPGEYNMSASFFYLNDTTAPIITITNKSYFDQYFRDGSYVYFNVTIIEGNGLQDYRASITNHSPQISFSKEWVDDNVYHFYQTLPNSEILTEGDYLITAFAKDIAGNEGSDSVIIKLDLTAPEIELVEPFLNGTIYSEMISIKINITDEKAGVDKSEVYYRLREMNKTDVCPETGIGTWSCTNTGWLNLDYNSPSQLYEKEVNTTELNLNSGEYWLDIRASDILGNKRTL